MVGINFVIIAHYSSGKMLFDIFRFNNFITLKSVQKY